MIRRWMLTLLALLALAPFLVLATHAKKGGNKPPPEPPPPADPAITYCSLDGLWVMNADGSNQTIVYDDDMPIHPSWSGDGEHIAFSIIQSGEYELWRVDVSVMSGVPVGSNARVLVDDVDAVSPAWSPTSDVIAFTAWWLTEGEELRLVPASGGTQQTLYTAAPGDWISGTKAWSPDGTRIAFYERIDGVYCFRVFDLTTETITVSLDLRSENHSSFSGLSWARTDDLLVYSESTTYVIVKGKKEYTHYRWTVRTLDLDTGLATTVPSATDDGGLQGRFPAWSPDDSKLVIKWVAGLDAYDFATGLTEDLDTVAASYPDWRR